MIKVVKFGGSSLASATQFSKVGKIIKADPERKFVVPSAPGKRNDKDTKVTDMLYACYALAKEDKSFSSALKKIKDRYDTIINGLHLKLSSCPSMRNLRLSRRTSQRRQERIMQHLVVSTLMVLSWQII